MPPAVDVALAAALVVAGQLELWWSGFLVTVDPQVTSKPLVAVAEALGAAALAWRRVAPTAVLAVVVGAFSAEQVAAHPPDTLTGLIVMLVATGTAAALSEGRARVVALGLVGIGLLASVLRDPGNFPFLAVLLAAAWLAGRTVHRGRVTVGLLESRARTLERESDERARTAAIEERLRIARELHDLVAHHISALVLQAGAARQVIDSDPDRAARAMSIVEQEGREALDEMRQLLLLLRARDEPAARDPQPGLQRVSEMADRMRVGGVDVRVHTSGEVRPLPAGVDLSAYRIVQEALTNAMRHGTPRSIDVAVRYLPGQVEIEIKDDGGGGSPTSGGNGLTGMRERAALHGGRVDAGPHNDGFRVVALLPTPGA
jgi:signal transduction histidine kinase